jgi:hypothetical protein
MSSFDTSSWRLWHPSTAWIACAEAEGKAIARGREGVSDDCQVSTTLMMQAVVPAKVIQERLGHSNIATTWTSMRTSTPACRKMLPDTSQHCSTGKIRDAGGRRGFWHEEAATFFPSLGEVACAGTQRNSF